MANSLDIKCDNPSPLKKCGGLFETHLRYKHFHTQTTNEQTQLIHFNYIHNYARDSLHRFQYQCSLRIRDDLRNRHQHSLFLG